MVIEDKLRENAALYPDKVALVCGEKSLTYRQLYQAIKDKADSMGGYKRMPDSYCCIFHRRTSSLLTLRFT